MLWAASYFFPLPESAHLCQSRIYSKKTFKKLLTMVINISLRPRPKTIYITFGIFIIQENF